MSSKAARLCSIQPIRSKSLYSKLFGYLLHAFTLTCSSESKPPRYSCLPSSQMCDSQRLVRTWCVTPLNADVLLLPCFSLHVVSHKAGLRVCASSTHPCAFSTHLLHLGTSPGAACTACMFRKRLGNQLTKHYAANLEVYCMTPSFC